MKKVRYAVAALGMTPVLGVVTPALAAGAAGQAMARTGKMVTLTQRDVPLAPDAVCVYSKSKSSHTGTGANHFRASVYYSGSGEPKCVWGTFGILSHEQSSLLLRTRVYSNGHYTSYKVNGHFNHAGGYTYFSDDGIGHKGDKACEALINSNTLAVKYGPVCENI